MRLLTLIAASTAIALPAFAFQETEAPATSQPAEAADAAPAADSAPATYVGPMVMTTPVAAEAPGKADTSRVTAGTYNVDPAHTVVSFTVDHLGFSSYTGQFGNPSGTLTLDPANPTAASVEITFPVASVSTTSEKLDEHLQSADFFDAANNPNVTFVSNQVVVDGNNAVVRGDLTIRGVTKPAILQVQFYGAGANPMSQAETIGFRATTTIKRSEFGMEYGVPMVSDEVLLLIDAAFEKGGEAPAAE